MKLDVIKDEIYNGFGELQDSYERTEWALGDAYIGIDDYTMTDQVPYECLRAKGTIYIIENLPEDIVYGDEYISYINVGKEGDYETIRWRVYEDGRQVTSTDNAEFIESLY